MKKALLVVMVLCCTGCANQSAIWLGDTRVIVQAERHGPGKSFVHVHQNETTALKAARVVARREGGSVLTLVHPGGRNITFHLDGKRYEFDPNRIFTTAGIKKTLAQFSQDTPEAEREVQKLATRILDELPSGKIIAVHNNESYSLRDYLPGRPLARDITSLNMEKQNYFRNFYLVTRLEDYTRLKQLRFNSVLQKQEATDDGSLSVYLASSEYINVEAGYDQLAAQIKMLQSA